MTYHSPPPPPTLWSPVPHAQQSVGSFHAQCDSGIPRFFILCASKYITAVRNTTRERTCRSHGQLMGNPASCFTGETEAMGETAPHSHSPPTHPPLTCHSCAGFSASRPGLLLRPRPAFGAAPGPLAYSRPSSSDPLRPQHWVSSPLVHSHRHTVMRNSSRLKHTTHACSQGHFALLPFYTKTCPRAFMMDSLFLKLICFY